MLNDMSRILLTREQIAQRVNEIGREMSHGFFLCVRMDTAIFP